MFNCIKRRNGASKTTQQFKGACSQVQWPKFESQYPHSRTEIWQNIHIHTHQMCVCVYFKSSLTCKIWCQMTQQITEFLQLCWALVRQQILAHFLWTRFLLGHLDAGKAPFQWSMKTLNISCLFTDKLRKFVHTYTHSCAHMRSSGTSASSAFRGFPIPEEFYCLKCPNLTCT